jgi:hypothetical protein
MLYSKKQGMPKMPVEIKGLAETLAAMRKFEPDLAKNLNKEVRAALTPVQKKAQGFFPSTVPGLSNWMLVTKGHEINKKTSAFAAVNHFPRYNKGIASRGIKIFIGQTKKNTRGFVTFYRIANITAAGAIFEIAGRAGGKSRREYKSNNPLAGQHFMDSLTQPMAGKGAKQGRALYRAWDEDQGRAFGHVLKAVDATIIEFGRRATASLKRAA